MMPVSLESTDYHDLRSKWFRVSHKGLDCLSLKVHQMR